MTPFDRLKLLADKQGLSINDVETKVGIGTNTLYSWKKNLSKVADFFHVSTDYLLGRTDDPSIADKPSKVDLADEDVIMTFEGQKIPPEDIELMKRLLRGKGK